MWHTALYSRTDKVEPTRFPKFESLLPGESHSAPSRRMTDIEALISAAVPLAPKRAPRNPKP